MIKVNMRVGDSISIGDTIIRLDERSGQGASFSVDAKIGVPVRRIKAATKAEATSVNNIRTRGVEP